nr:ATP-binding protein [uncultured Flavobacterium sp.]
MSKQIILLIGGPGSGKTTIIDGLSERGYICYPEISREVTLEAKRKGIDQLFLTEPLLFSQMLLDGRIKQYKNALNETADLVFIDRGIPDVLAYMHFIGDKYPKEFHEACKAHIYTKIFILPPWEEIFESDNERYENYEQAKQIHEHLIETYQSYGYSLNEVPKADLNTRIEYILSKL